MPFIHPSAETAVPEGGVASPSDLQNQPPQQQDAAAASGEAELFATYDGTARAVGRIAVVNAVLGLLTLGIYRFWGKTHMRRYLWSRIAVLGDRVEYSGTPRELFLGFLVAAAVLMGLFAVYFGISVAFSADTTAYGVVQGIYFLGLYFLIFFAVFRARRYRLSRTQWRGIHFSQSGSAGVYALKALGLYLLAVLTLGLALPYAQTRLQAYRTSNTWFGNKQLVFEGRAKDLFWRWFLAWILALPTLGLALIWYAVVAFRYYTGETRYESIRFTSHLTTWNAVWIYLRYFLIIAVLYMAAVGGIAALIIEADVFGTLQSSGQNIEFADLSLALKLKILAVILLFVSLLNALQFVLLYHPLLRKLCATLRVRGTVDLEAIEQNDDPRLRRGEGFADVLDVGAI